MKLTAQIVEVPPNKIENLVYSRWVGDGRLEYKMDTSKAQKPAWRSCDGSLMAEMKQNQHCGSLDY